MKDPAHNLRRKTRYLVASEVLSDILQDLGYHTWFMPPIYAPQNESVVTKRSNPRSYCYVGNMTELKRVGDLNQLKEKYENLPINIHIVGYVDEVPYWKHDGYISTSQKELFANACVEAMSFGLIPLLSNVEIAHQYYAAKNPDVCLFDSPDELANIVKNLYESENEIIVNHTISFVKDYSIEEVSKKYLLINKSW